MLVEPLVQTAVVAAAAGNHKGQLASGSTLETRLPVQLTILHRYIV